MQEKLATEEQLLSSMLWMARRQIWWLTH